MYVNVSYENTKKMDKNNYNFFISICRLNKILKWRRPKNGFKNCVDIVNKLRLNRISMLCKALNYDLYVMEDPLI